MKTPCVICGVPEKRGAPHSPAECALNLRAEVERLRLGNIRLRSVAESATEVSCARTGSIWHRCGECRACMVRVRASAALSAPAEEEGRDE